MESSDGSRILFLFAGDELQGHAISFLGLRVLLLFLIYISFIMAPKTKVGSLLKWCASQQLLSRLGVGALFHLPALFLRVKYSRQEEALLLRPLILSLKTSTMPKGYDYNPYRFTESIADFSSSCTVLSSSD
jgi:hypothetical protein